VRSAAAPIGPDGSRSGRRSAARVWPVGQAAAHRPTFGRDQLLTELVRHLERQGGPILLSGPAGIGKTHLARASIRLLVQDGADSEEIIGGGAPSAVPLGPAAHLVPAIAGEVPLAGLIAAALDGLRRRTADRRLIVLADDIDLLDDASATLIGHLARVERVAIVGTSRRPVRPRHLFADLWRDGLVRVVSLNPLSPPEAAELAEFYAGGPLDPSSGLRVYDITGGNPLWITELTRAAVARGALRPGRTGFRLDTEVAVGGLDRILADRISDLTPAERDALDLIAAGGPLPSASLQSLTGAEALASLAEAGLVEVTGSRKDPVIRFAHPLHRQLVRSRQEADQVQGLLRRLSAAEAPPGPVNRAVDPGERASLVRLALWHAEMGEAFDPEALGWAAQEVRWGLLELVRRHLAGEPVSPESSDAALAIGLQRPDERASAAHILATGAWKEERTFANGMALARLLTFQPDKSADALEVFDSLRSLAVTEAERAAVATIHGIWLHWVARDRSGAAALLSKAAAELGPPWRSMVASTRAGLGVHCGDTAEGLIALEEAWPGEDAPPVVKLSNWSPRAAALVNSGRLEEGVALAEAALPVSFGLGGDGMQAMAELTIIHHWGRMCLGRYGEVLRDARQVSDLLRDADQDEARALFMGLEARCLSRWGRPGRAAAVLEEAIRRHGPLSTLGFRSLLHSSRAVALAWTGRLREAEMEADEAAHWSDPPRFFDADIDMARATVLAANGQRSRATRLAAAAAEKAASLGSFFFAFEPAFLAARLDATEGRVRALEELAEHVDGPFPRLAVAYARALAGAGADDLKVLSNRALALGEKLFALEMLEAAALLDSGSPVGRSRNEAAIERLRRECEGARSPVMAAATVIRGLTSREVEIVSLAARGWSSPAIAEELVLSVRTVESHLYRAFAKMGVKSRAELAARYRLKPGNSSNGPGYSAEPEVGFEPTT
jgi:DNA-binding CsgD family transcriptional regulator